MSVLPPTTGPLRTKRNFKALALPDPDAAYNAPPAREEALPVATRPAPPPRKPSGPSPGGPTTKKRPPPFPADSLPDASSGLHPRDTLAPMGGMGMGGLGGPLHDPYMVAETPATGRRDAIQSSLNNALAKLDLHSKETGQEALIDVKALKDADFEKLAELGHGNGGSVVKVRHLPTGIIIAKKIVFIDAKSAIRKQIQRELAIMHECHSPYIISCYGSYLAEPNINICMEFMDKGSFDSIYKKIGAVDINVVCLLAHSVLEGLTYLYDAHRIIHRDIKPSNILANSKGEIKLCDFGVSGELINSLAKTFVGTSIYMSPERIKGAEYSVKSDVWSLGITLVEIATGRFPFCDVTDGPDEEVDSYSDLSDLEERDEGGPGGRYYDAGATHHANRTPTHRDSFALSSGKLSNKTLGARKRESIPPKKTKRLSKRLPEGTSLSPGGGGGDVSSLSIVELMQQIISEPAPTLGGANNVGGRFSDEAIEFVDACLMKDPDVRNTPKTLLEYPWMDDARDSTFDLAAWAQSF